MLAYKVAVIKGTVILQTVKAEVVIKPTLQIQRVLEQVIVIKRVQLMQRALVAGAINPQIVRLDQSVAGAIVIKQTLLTLLHI